MSVNQTAGRNPQNAKILAEARRGAMLVSLVERHIGSNNLRKNGTDRYAANSEHCPECRRGGTSPNALSVFVGNDGYWRWKCQSCGAGGTAIDWMIAVSGNMSALDAAKAAVGGLIGAQAPAPAMTREAVAKNAEEAAEKTRAMGHVLQRLRGLGGYADEQVVAYLRSRAITGATVGIAGRAGILRTLPGEPYRAHRFLCDVLGDAEHSGEAWLKLSGLMKPDAKMTALAYRPLLFLGGTWLEARIIHPPKGDEPKSIRYGVTSTPLSIREGKPEDVTLVTTVEGPIDFLSKIEMGLNPGQVLVGIPGVQSWKAEWFLLGAKAYPNARWEVALDNDEPGHAAADKIAAVIDGTGKSWFRSVPFEGKDLNDELMGRFIKLAA